MEKGFAYQEYTSSSGGNIVFPLSFSFFKNLLRSKNSLDSISSFNCDNQLSCRVSISSFSSSFCSSFSFSSHLALSNFGAAIGGSEGLGLVNDDKGLICVAAPPDLASVAGCFKNEVMLAFALGFFTAPAVVAATSPALRLSGVVIALAVDVREGGIKVKEMVRGRVTLVRLQRQLARCVAW